MAGDVPVLDMSYVAGQDFSATTTILEATGYSAQFRAVYMYTDGTMHICGTGNPMWGILQNDPEEGDIAVVREIGHSKAVMASTSANYGVPLKVADAYGRLGTASYGSDVVVATAAGPWAAANDIAEVSLITRGTQGTYYRAGQLMFGIKLGVMCLSTGSHNVYASLPLGFNGTIVGVYGLYTTATSVSSGAGTLDFVLSTAGQVEAANSSAVTLAVAASTAAGTVVAESAAPTKQNTFVAGDTLTIHSNISTAFTSDPGVIEVHIITN